MSNYPVYVIEEDIGTYIHRLTTENDKLRKEVARLREALKPFAKARWGNDEDGWLLAKGIQHVEVTNARAALNSEDAA